MGKSLISLAAYRVYQMKILSHGDLRKMRYGMEVVLNEMIKITILLALFIVLDKVVYFLFSLAILISIRCFSGGIHFQTNFSCLLFSFFFFVITSFAVMYLPVEYLQYRYLAMALSIGTIGIFSPIPSINRPIKSIRKQRILKFTAVLLTTLWGYILLFKIQSSELTICGITTIMFQALQLITSYSLNLFENTNIKRLRYRDLFRKGVIPFE